MSRGFPTEFTADQLSKLRELVGREHSRMGGGAGRVADVTLHHLEYKLGDYERNARFAERNMQRRTA